MKKKQLGMTFIESMVSIAVVSILSLAVITTFSTNSSVMMAHSLKTKANEEGKAAFDMISRLVRQTNHASIEIKTTETSTTLDLTLPAGYPIWPNDVSPYTDNAVRIQWENSESGNANQIRIGKANSLTGLNSAVLETLVGHSSSMETSIVDFQVKAIADGKYYEVTLASLATLPSDLAPTETVFQGYVLPRN